MSERDRGDEAELDEVGRALVRAARSGGPRGGVQKARQRAFVAASGVLAASGTSGAAAAAGAGKAAWVIVAKVVSVSVLGVGVVTAAGVTLVERSRMNAAPSQSASAPSQSPPSPRQPPPSVPVALESASPDAGAAPAAASIPPAPATPPSHTSAPRTASLPEELAKIDQARAAIAAGQPATALQVLDAYAGRFPNGAMGPEATVLRVQALLEAGDRHAAERAAERLLRADPTSPYAHRVRSLLGGKL